MSGAAVSTSFEAVGSNIQTRAYLGLSSKDEAELHVLVGSYIEELLRDA